MQEEFEDTKGVIRIRISKNRQLNDQKKKGQKDKQRSTIHTHKTKDRVIGTPLKTGCELGCSGRVGSFCSTSGNPNQDGNYATSSTYDTTQYKYIIKIKDQ